jgi:hypothetical protein
MRRKQREEPNRVVSEFAAAAECKAYDGVVAKRRERNRVLVGARAKGAYPTQEPATSALSAEVATDERIAGK